MRKSLAVALLLVIRAGGPAVAQETEAAGPLTVDGGLVIWTLVVFGLLLYVLKRQAWPVLLARARKEIDEEKGKALLALRREAVDLSIAAASKLLDATLDSEANRRLVTEYLADLELRR